jgi:hypothetical protein
VSTLPVYSSPEILGRAALEQEDEEKDNREYGVGCKDDSDIPEVAPL